MFEGDEFLRYKYALAPAQAGALVVFSMVEAPACAGAGNTPSH